MKLQPPKEVTFWVSIILVIIGIILLAANMNPVIAMVVVLGSTLCRLAVLSFVVWFRTEYFRPMTFRVRFDLFKTFFSFGCGQPLFMNFEVLQRLFGCEGMKIPLQCFFHLCIAPENEIASTN